MTSLKELLNSLNATRDMGILPVLADRLEEDGDARSDGLRWLIQERHEPIRHLMSGTKLWCWYWWWSGQQRSFKRAPKDSLPWPVFEILGPGCRNELPACMRWTTPRLDMAMMAAAEAFVSSKYVPEKLTLTVINGLIPRGPRWTPALTVHLTLASSWMANREPPLQALLSLCSARAILDQWTAVETIDPRDLAACSPFLVRIDGEIYEVCRRCRKIAVREFSC